MLTTKLLFWHKWTKLWFLYLDPRGRNLPEFRTLVLVPHNWPWSIWECLEALPSVLGACWSHRTYVAVKRDMLINRLRGFEWVSAVHLGIISTQAFLTITLFQMKSRMSKVKSIDPWQSLALKPHPGAHSVPSGVEHSEICLGNDMKAASEWFLWVRGRRMPNLHKFNPTAVSIMSNNRIFLVLSFLNWPILGIGLSCH